MTRYALELSEDVSHDPVAVAEVIGKLKNNISSGKRVHILAFEDDGGAFVIDRTFCEKGAELFCKFLDDVKTMHEKGDE